MLARAKALHAEIENFSTGQSLLDAQPRIEESSDVLLYKLGDRQPWHQFLDGKGLTSAGNLSKLQREIDIISKLQIFIDLGYKWSVFVYTYRSILKTLPQVESAQQANKDEVYREYYTVLLPAISSMRLLKDFTFQACDYLCEVIDLVQAQPETLSSDQLLLQLIRLMDVLLVIDSIKSARGALNNDFSFYKRAEKEVMRFDRSVPDKSLENSELYTYLANTFSTITRMQEAISKLRNFDEVVASILNLTVELFEQQRFMVPSEKFMLVRVVALALCLLASNDSKAPDLFKKKYKADKYLKILRPYPVVPVFGDIPFSPINILRLAKYWKQLQAEGQLKEHFIPSSLGEAAAQEFAQNFELVHHRYTIRDAYVTYLNRFGLTIAHVRHELKGRKSIDAGQLSAVFELVVEGLRLLRDWSVKIHEQTAWKNARPASVEQMAKRRATVIEESAAAKKGHSYASVVALNYSADEKLALAEVLAMVKGLAAELRKAESLLAPLLREHVHRTLQDLLQNDLTGMIKHSVRRLDSAMLSASALHRSSRLSCSGTFGACVVHCRSCDSTGAEVKGREGTARRPARGRRRLAGRHAAATA
jgi:cytoplasmic FMR1 interacting protein